MKCILFGAGGREAIIAKELAKKFELYAYMAHKNPTIVEAVEKSRGKYIIDKTYNLDNIRKFLLDNKLQLCVVNNDNLLEEGVIDLAKECGLKTFGPTREGARVEWDKAYTIQLVQKIMPKAVVRTEIVTSQRELDNVMSQIQNANFVIKPNGLTGGKGVKVGDVHFSTKEQGLEYAKNYLEKDACVIIQDKMIGHEFTVMGFTNGKDLILAPCTYDYPYRYDNDEGAGTGGMGAISFPNGLLPFLTEEDIAVCKHIMQKTIDELNKDKINFNGVLNGGFFKTQRGIYFMEFNARLGDPETMNLLSLLDTPFADIAENIALEKELNNENCKFAPLSSYVVYVVNKDYATTPNAKPITFSINEELKNNPDVDLYCSSMEETDIGKYTSIGNSRLYALVKTGKDLKEIKVQVDDLLQRNVNKKDSLDYRSDIGKTGIQTVFILGSNSREIVLAKKLASEGYTVHVMSNTYTPNLVDSNIIYHNNSFDINIIKDVNPDYVFAFNEKYIFNEQINNLLHDSLGKSTKVCLPKFEHLFLEKDKHKVRRMLGKDEMIRVSSQAEFDKFLTEKGKIFVRINSPFTSKFQIFEVGKNTNEYIDFRNSEVLVEPFYEGENVTITYYIDNGAITILPPVFDYPYYISSNGDFVKTSGVMCEYSSSKNDEIGIMQIAQALKNDIFRIVPHDYCGFLAAQILYNKETGKYSFVEFDVKPGEPEFINIINAIDGRFDSILTNTYPLYIPETKENESLSVVIASKKFPVREDICISKYKDVLEDSEDSNLQIHYSSVNTIDQNTIHNVNGGRLGFVYMESANKEDLQKGLTNYKKAHSDLMSKCGLNMFLLDTDSKKLVESIRNPPPPNIARKEITT